MKEEEIFKMFTKKYIYIFLIIVVNVNAVDFSFLTRYFYKYADDENINNNFDSDRINIDPVPQDHEIIQHKNSSTTLQQQQQQVKKCNENALMLHLANLQVTSLERIMLLLTLDSVNDMCRNLENTIIAIQYEFQSCISLEKDNLYLILYQGIKFLYRNICENDKSKIKDKILNYQLCYKDLREEYIDCEGPADWFENTNKSILCRTFQDIINCEYIITAELCGLEAAHLMYCLTRDLFNHSLITKCDLKNPPNIQNSMPYIAISSTGNGVAYGLHLKLLYICFVGSIKMYTLSM